MSEMMPRRILDGIILPVLTLPALPRVPMAAARTLTRRLAGVVLALAPTLLVSQSAPVRGIVTDADTGRPVVGARVALGAWLGGWTGSDGRFQFPAPTGRYLPLVSCPERNGSGLAAEGDSISVPGAEDLVLRLAHGEDCLQPLSATPYGEFTGVLTAAGATRFLQLCDGPGHHIAIEFRPEQLRAIAYRATRSEDAHHPQLAVKVRGRLEGPGFFGTDGSAAYLIEVEKVVTFRKRTEADACKP